MNNTYIQCIWHSLEHRECKGIYTSKEEAIEAIAEHHEIPLDEFMDLRQKRQENKLNKNYKSPFRHKAIL